MIINKLYSKELNVRLLINEIGSLFFLQKKQLVLSASLLLMTTLVFAQPTNQNFNYQVNTIGGYWIGNDDDGGQEEPTIKMGACHDLNGTPTAIINPTYTATTTTCATTVDCHIWADWCHVDVGGCTSTWNVKLLTATNKSLPEFDLECVSWEDDDVVSCVLGTAYNRKGNNFDTFNAKSINPQPNAWSDESDFLEVPVNNSKGYFKTAWRYTNGTKLSPLTFGNVAGQESHVNSNRSKPDGADNDLGYTNDWEMRPSSDVTYTFSVQNPAKTVSISTDFTETTFDTYISLLDSGGNIIAFNDDVVPGSNSKSIITQELCAGTYTVVVEGYYSGSTGDFKLGINASNINLDAGSITATDTEVCEGVEIPAINSSAAAQSINGNAPTYQWQVWTGTAWEDIPGQTGISMTNPGTMPASFLRYFRRTATVCGASNSSDYVIISRIISSLNAGDISLDGSIVIPGNNDPGSIDSNSDASGSPSPITYEWQQCTSNCSNQENWSVASGSANSSSYDIPVLNERTSFRRQATNGCGQTARSNEVEITTIVPNGVISGRVTSPSGIGGPAAGVPGVTVTATRTTTVFGENLDPGPYTAVTDNQGYYNIINIYYADNAADFTITPSKIEGDITHVFSPAEYTNQAISTTFNTLSNKDFTDETTFTFSGNVYQDFNGTLCGMDSVGILLNGVSVDSTDFNGDYAIAIPSIGDYTIEAVYQGHSFTPSDYNMYIDADNFDMNFENTSTQQVSGFAGGGCSTYLGQAEIRFWTDDLCIDHTHTTDVGTGNFLITLPARRYNVQLVNFDNPAPYGELEVEAFFNLVSIVDLTNEDQTKEFIYRPPPVVRVNGLPDEVCNRTILEQGIPLDLTIEIFEGVLDGCPVDTGTILITNEIGDLNDEVISIPFRNGMASYTLNPATPNIVFPNMKNLTIVAMDTLGQSITYSLDALVTGVRPREQTFTTVTPEIPMLILRDPPGDASYSFVEQTETMELATSFYNLVGGSVNEWADVKIGTQFESGFIAFSSESEVWGQVGSSLEIGATSTSTKEAIMSVSTTQTFSTSGNADVTGTDGDVFVGAAMNMLYAAADIIGFDESNCMPTYDVDLVIKNDGFATTYIYTEQYIREVTVVQLEFLEANTTNPDSALFYSNQIDVWEQTLARNEQLKENAVFQQNISFSNNAPYDDVTTATTSESLTIEFNTEINEEVATEVGLDIGGSGVANGVVATFKVEFGESQTGTTTSGFTTGFHLEDNDVGDGFTVDVLTDPVYKTPVFKLISGITSCPYEAGTQPRDEPMLSVVNPIITDVDPTTEAEFTFQLKNTSQSGEARTYLLAFNQASNPDGAEILVGGSPYISPIAYYIPYLGTIQVTVKVGLGASGVYTYEGLGFSLYPDCDEALGETVVVSAFFDSPCSDVGLFEPIDGWKMNETDDILEIHIKDYDKTQLDQIQVQQSPAGSSAWATIQVLDNEDLNNNNPGGTNLGTVTEVNLSNVDEGAYDIRLKLVCGSSSVYSSRASGTIDRTAPVMLGTPQPNDDNYDSVAGDEISAQFNEVLVCNNASAEIINLNTNETISTQVLCFENELTIVPDIDLPTDALYQVNLIGLKDGFGNSSSLVSWAFAVGNYVPPVDCGPIVISNNNATYNAIEPDVYNGTIIQSAAKVSSGSVEMLAELSVGLKSGFEVLPGAEFTADIEGCPETPDENAPCHSAIAIELGNIYPDQNSALGSLAMLDGCGPGNTGTPGLWYVLSGSDQSIVVSTCDMADFDTVIEVYTGTCGAPLTCYTFNNDVGSCSDNSSEIVFWAAAGVDYYILIRGYNGFGNFDLSVELEIP